MNLLSANILGIIIFILLVIVSFLLGYQFTFNHPFMLTLMILYFIIHELLHGLVFFIGGTKLKNIVFGMAIEKGILYCQAFFYPLEIKLSRIATLEALKIENRISGYTKKIQYNK